MVPARRQILAGGSLRDTGMSAAYFLHDSTLGGVSFNPDLRWSAHLVKRTLQAGKTLPPPSHRLIETIVVMNAVQISVGFDARSFRTRFWIDGLWQISRTRLHGREPSQKQTHQMMAGLDSRDVECQICESN